MSVRPIWSECSSFKLNNNFSDNNFISFSFPHLASFSWNCLDFCHIYHKFIIRIYREDFARKISKYLKYVWKNIFSLSHIHCKETKWNNIYFNIKNIFFWKLNILCITVIFSKSLIINWSIQKFSFSLKHFYFIYYIWGIV